MEKEEKEEQKNGRDNVMVCVPLPRMTYRGMAAVRLALQSDDTLRLFQALNQGRGRQRAGKKRRKRKKKGWNARGRETEKTRRKWGLQRATRQNGCLLYILFGTCIGKPLLTYDKYVVFLGHLLENTG